MKNYLVLLFLLCAFGLFGISISPLTTYNGAVAAWTPLPTPIKPPTPIPPTPIPPTPIAPTPIPVPPTPIPPTPIPPTPIPPTPIPPTPIPPTPLPGVTVTPTPTPTATPTGGIKTTRAWIAFRGIDGWVVDINGKLIYSSSKEPVLIEIAFPPQSSTYRTFTLVELK